MQKIHPIINRLLLTSRPVRARVPSTALATAGPTYTFGHRDQTPEEGRP